MAAEQDRQTDPQGAPVRKKVRRRRRRHSRTPAGIPMESSPSGWPRKLRRRTRRLRKLRRRLRRRTRRLVKRLVQVGRLNWRLLALLALGMAILVGGMIGGQRLHRRRVADRARLAGEAAWKAGGWQEAARQWRVYLEKNPSDLDILLRYAKANLEVRPRTPRDVGAAIGAYRRYLDLRPADEEVTARLCHLYAGTRNHVQVAEVARRRLAVAPDDRAAAVYLGRALVAQGKHDEALEFLTKFVIAHPEVVEPYAILSDLALQGHAGNAQAEGLAWLDRAVRANPTSAEALARRARFYQKMKSNVQAARADLEAAEQLKPADLKSLLLLAEGWFEFGELDRASGKLDAIRRFEGELAADGAVDIRNLALGLFVAEGNLLLRQGRKDDGVRLADRALAELAGTRREVFLPLAVDLYLAAGQINPAWRLVNEYEASVEAQTKPEEWSLNQLALLQAAVAGAENQPHRVINILGPIIGGKNVGVTTVGGIENVQVWRLLGRAYAMTGQDRRALEALDRYVLRCPNDPDAVLELAKAYYRSGAFARALDLAGTAERLRPDNIEARILRIRASIRQTVRAPENPFVSPAYTELASLRDAHRGDVRIRVLMAQMALSEGRSADAVAELEQATRECDDPLPAWLELAALHERQKRPQQAVEACRNAANRFTTAALPRVLWAEVLSRMGRPDDARGVLEQAAGELAAAERAAVQFALAKLHLQQGRRDEGIDLLLKLADEAPGEERSRLQLLRQPEIQADAARAQRLIDELRLIEGDWGLRWQLAQAELWLRQKDWRVHQPEILARLQRCIENDPAWSEPVAALGLMYEKLGQDNKAEEVYYRFHSNNPKPTEVLIRLFDLLQRQQRYAAAARLLDRVSDKLPFLGTLRIKAAIGQGDFEGAIRDLRERIGADPDDAMARVVLARLVYHAHQDHAVAYKLLDEARAIAPNLILGATTRVAMLRAQGRVEEAKAFLDEEVARRKDFDAYAMRAEFLAEIGRNDAAELDYRHLTTFKDLAVEGYQRLGDFYAKTHRNSQAIVAWEEGRKLQPDDLRLTRSLIGALLASGEPADRDRGRRILDDDLQRFPDEPGLLSLKAVLLLGDRSPEAAQEALQILERLVELNPRDIVAHLYLMEQARLWGDVQGERRFADRALGSNPDNPALLSAKAGLEQRQGNLRVAWQLALSAIRLAPENVTARILLVYLGLRTGRYDEAEKYAAEALKLEPADEEVNLVYALALNALNRRAEAIQLLETYRKGPADRPSLRVLLLLADLYRFEGDLDAAEVRISEAEAMDASQPSTFVARLRCLASRKRFDEVLARYSQRRAAQENEPQVTLAVASILAYAGQDRYVREARSLYEGLTQSNPDDLAGYLGLGQVANELGEAGAAIQAFRQAVKIDPYHQQALNNLAWLLAATTDNLAEALELANQGLVRYEDDPNLYDTRGTIFLKQGQAAKAKADFEKSLRLLKEDSAARVRTLVHLGQACLQLQDRPAAGQSLNEALELDRAVGVLTATERTEALQMLRNAGGVSPSTAPAGLPASRPASDRSAANR